MQGNKSLPSTISYNTIVLGATGFIGKHLCHELDKSNIKYIGLSSRDVDLTSASSVNKFNKNISSNTIIIFAAAIVREKGDTPETLQKNISMAVNVSNILNNKNICRCIYLSSADVYGPQKVSITEKTKTNPQTYYAVAKLASEYILGISASNNNIPLLVLRYSGIFGPEQSEQKYGPNAFIYSIIKKNTVKLWGNGKEKRNFLYVKDLTKILVSLINSNNKGVINVATGKNSSFEDVIHKLKTIVKSDFKIIKQKRTSKAVNQKFNIKKLKSAIPDFLYTTLDDALYETYSCVKKQK